MTVKKPVMTRLALVPTKLNKKLGFRIHAVRDLAKNRGGLDNISSGLYKKRVNQRD